MKQNLLMKFTVAIVAIVFLGGCKFYFNESDYLGTYTGSFDSDTTTYKDCNGTLIITDAGDFKADMQLVSDSNPTFYFTNVTIQRGFSLVSQELRFYTSGSYGAGGGINRTNHSAYLLYQSGPSYYDFTFYGNRQ